MTRRSKHALLYLAAENAHRQRCVASIGHKFGANIGAVLQLIPVKVASTDNYRSSCRRDLERDPTATCLATCWDRLAYPLVLHSRAAKE